MKPFPTFSGNSRAHLALITANVLFGLNYSYSKSIIGEALSPLALALLRVIVAAALFLIVFFVTAQKPIERKDLGRMAVATVLGLVANQFVFLQGLRFTSPVDASIITTIIPVLVLVISALFLRERMGILRTAGIAVGAAGASLAILHGGLSALGRGSIGGNLLVLTSSTCYAGYLVWAKPLLQKYNPVVIMTYLFVMGTLMTLPFFGGALFRSDFSTIRPEIWGAIVFVLLFPTFLAYLFVGFGLRKVKSTTVSIYQYLQPVVAAFFAVFRGQDSLTGTKILAAALVFAGVLLVTESSRLESLFIRKKRKGRPRT